MSELKTKAELLFDYIEDAVDKAKMLGVESVGRIDEAGGLTLGVTFDNGEDVFVAVEPA